MDHSTFPGFLVVHHVYLEVFLVSLEHTVEPGKELLGAVVRVQNDRHAVVFGHQPGVLGAGNGAEDGGSLEEKNVSYGNSK